MITSHAYLLICVHALLVADKLLSQKGVSMKTMKITGTDCICRKSYGFTTVLA